MKITIGIPTYNQPQFINAAVASALAIDLPNLEVIVSDDSTNDQTEKAIEIFKQDARFQYYKNKKRIGRVNNYRKLLYEYATGDWYLNLDGDDYLLPTEFFNNAIEAVKRDDKIVMAIGYCEIRNEQSGEVHLFKNHYPNGTVMDGEQFLADIINCKAQPAHLSVMYHRKKALGIDFYRLNVISSDFESIYRLAIHGKVLFINDIVGVWRKHGNNTVEIKDRHDSFDNLSVTDSLAEYGRMININIDIIAAGLRRQMMGSMLREAKKEGYLTWMTFNIFLKYPFDSLLLIKELWNRLKYNK